jgi:hypothetical protein
MIPNKGRSWRRQYPTISSHHLGSHLPCSFFLSVNSADRTSVIGVQRLLQVRGITTFLDRDKLVSGLTRPQALEQAPELLPA